MWSEEVFAPQTPEWFLFGPALRNCDKCLAGQELTTLPLLTAAPRPHLSGVNDTEEPGGPGAMYLESQHTGRLRQEDQPDKVAT